jgi:hypothetical protein
MSRSPYGNIRRRLREPADLDPTKNLANWIASVNLISAELGVSEGLQCLLVNDKCGQHGPIRVRC